MQDGNFVGVGRKGAKRLRFIVNRDLFGKGRRRRLRRKNVVLRLLRGRRREAYQMRVRKRVCRGNRKCRNYPRLSRYGGGGGRQDRSGRFGHQACGLCKRYRVRQGVSNGKGFRFNRRRGLDLRRRSNELY